ncbi:hypothetical protein THERMOS_33 [Bathymodiolus thermophilus thioautotrophic gill symbiont]|uniref:Uncharacterized protein n=1 Tax=Bathymodiolus thermophilus thioautotrophic gill symbiont TaxID=2360 RepID=A0A8H8XBS0_9GAMM|nr:hypothetical protein THERMOS_33 [Bathymodiolus thermophilus thioautotrophic gill symbiont]
MVVKHYLRAPPKKPNAIYEKYKAALFHPKIYRIAGYSPYFWLRNALFSNSPKLHWGFCRCP